MKYGNCVAQFSGYSPVASFQSVTLHFDPAAIRKAYGNRDIDFLRVAYG